VDTLSVTGNTFSGGARGVETYVGYAAGAPAATVSLAKNHFERLSDGVFLVASEAAVTITDNVFTSIHASPGASRAGVAMHVFHTADVGVSAFPVSLEARGNSFLGNDVALKITGDFASTSAFRLGGDNDFLCNAAPVGALFPGADVWVVGTSGDGGALDLGGNLWDTGAPSVTRSSVFSNGSDIVLDGNPAPAVITSASSVSHASCPSARVP
jgi:hypothetical protein